MGLIYTASYGYRGSDRVDITLTGNERLLKAGLPAPGLILAPSNEILWPAKKRMDAEASRAGKLAVFAEYAKAYRSEMLRSFYRNAEAWHELARQHETTLVCFCADPELCHRSLAAQYLAAVSKGQLEICGERDRLRTGGCVSFELPGGVRGIMCGVRRAAPKRCQTPGCNGVCVALCDYPVVRRGGKSGTCDRRMCESCRHPVAGALDRDYCGPHHKAVSLPFIDNGRN